MGKTSVDDKVVKTSNGLGVSRSITYEDSCIPTPEELKKYQDINPDLVKFFIETTGKEQEARHKNANDRNELIKKESKRVFITNTIGQIFLVVVILSSMVLSYFLIMADKTIIGSIFGLVSLGTLAGVFYPRK